MMKAETRHEAGSQIYPSHFTPSTFAVARLLLVAALVAAPWALGGVETWAWVALGIGGLPHPRFVGQWEAFSNGR